MSGTIVSPCPPSTIAWMSSTETSSASARKARNRAVSSTPAIPMTRSRGNPVTCFVTQHMTSSGFETTRTMALGQCCLTCWETCFTMSALVRTRSSRLMPGLRAIPAVTTTSSLPAAAAKSLAPITRVSNPSIGADSHWSSALPWGTPSIMSTRTTRRASSCSARRWAAVAPTLPAPTTVILLSIRDPELTRRWSPAPGVHLAVWVRAQVRDRVQRAAFPDRQSLLRPTVGSPLPCVAQQLGDLGVARPRAQPLPQVDPAVRVQAQEPGAVRREPAAVAGAAKWRRGGRDDAEARPVGEPEALGRSAAVGRNRLDRAVALAKQVQDLLLGHDLVHGPARRAAHVHLLDEPHLGIMSAGELDQIRQLVVVESPDHDRVELESREARPLRRR